MAAAEQTRTQQAHRLPGRPGEAIDRSATLQFTFDGRNFSAHPGDTIASALAAAGVKVFSRSFKYHRPRGLLCCSGHCPNCLVQIEGEDGAPEPNVRACRRPVTDGLAVRSQNAWPSLDYDLMSLTQLGDRFLPVGFYYKTFIRPKPLWPLYEHVLRQAAGLGTIRLDSHSHLAASHQNLFADVVVVGGGPAGLSAALAAAERGARVLLFDENPSLGGHLRFSGQSDALPGLLGRLEGHDNLSVYTGTTVLGWYEDNWLAAMQGTRLYRIRTRSIVVAAGAYELPLVFDDNDLPGVMLGSAVQRLVRLYGVAPGQRALIAAANDDGWSVAADLLAAGVGIAAIADERGRDACQSPHRDRLAAEVPVFWQHALTAAHGSGSVARASLARVDGAAVDPSSVQTLACDLIVTSMGWAPATELAYQTGAKVVYDEARAEMMASSVPEGVYLAGRAAGTHGAEAALAEGRLAGLSAAAFAGLGSPPAPAEWEEAARARAAETRRTSPRVSAPGKKKQFVCYCEDVTKKDIQTSIAEGFDSMELLKRYSTVSMGPCQGKMCLLNSIHLCARENGWTVQATGTTTARPPMAPVSLAALAGQHLEPVQVTPLHEWHLAHGASLAIAGLWLRAERYGPSADEEVRAVRERVGLIDVSTLGKMRLSGPGVPALLERLYINQWKKLGIGRVRYGVMCNDEGVVLDDGVCAHLAEAEWYLTTTSSGAGAIYEWIQWWLQSGWGEGVHLTDLTETFAAFNLAGPQSRAVLQRVLDQGGAGVDISNDAFPYMHVRELNIAGVVCRVLRIGFTGELSYEIHCPAGYSLAVWEALMEAGREHDIRPFGLEAQRVLRLEKAHLIVSQDTDAMTDPISADMAWAVRLDKPDFLGRRSLVRIAEEGPKQKLVGFKMVDPAVVPEEGLQIVAPAGNGKLGIIGWVTSSRFSPTLKESIGLCWLPADVASQNGAAFTVRLQDGAGFAEARVHHGPFYDPDGARLRM